MKTSEFKRELKKIGDYEFDDNYVLTASGSWILFISSKSRNAIDTANALYGISDELFKLAVKYAATPIKEREDEKRYRIPLPNLKTSDGYQQYLSRKSKRNGHWFASRRQSNLIQAFTKAEVEQAPEAYRQYAVGLK
ncbi:hypothetical protein LOOC260_109660 [Paucilactobacillus hokkaidonensis JCM 18461]|uniref:Uncharacterized protein n=2 Tax=Paucilactobacillus hokkaidonensis TaxID=1193095 RepID=A0A0A1GU43_9LACO|nr:hypothetical protein [Paucilactobacillus hokkaidonensis]KRO07675.1 hypothetical protein IV59_GL001766 [Paucilactobacillus hokkaidonensis]BAP85505.1 hypothetical protein LOOC260_109660 [Paucilactobacillus hokkaidonensis JCM 18461]